MAIGAGSLALLFFFFFCMAAYRDIDLTLYTDLPDPSLAGWRGWWEWLVR